MDQPFNPARLAVASVVLGENIEPLAKFCRSCGGIDEPMPPGYPDRLAQPFRRRK